MTDTNPSAKRKIRLGELTAGEMRAILPLYPVILLPLGSHEDQGPHAPMGDYLSAERVAEHIALRATALGTPTFVAPVLPFGGADFFSSAPGGIALSQLTLRAVLGDMFACLMRHGLDRIIVINGHAGNVQAIHDTTHILWRKNRVLVPSLSLWRAAHGMLPSILGEDVAKRSAGHGANPLASVAMHLFPDLIRADLIPEPQTAPVVQGLTVSGFGTATFEGTEVAVPLEADEIAPSGVFLGDARLCCAATGAALVDRLTEIGARLAAHVARLSEARMPAPGL